MRKTIGIALITLMLISLFGYSQKEMQWLRPMKQPMQHLQQKILRLIG